MAGLPRPGPPPRRQEEKKLLLLLYRQRLGGILDFRKRTHAQEPSTREGLVSRTYKELNRILGI